MILARPAKTGGPGQDRGGGIHVANQNAQQAELSSPRGGAVFDRLPGSPHQHGLCRVTRAEPTQEAQQRRGTQPCRLEVSGGIAPSQSLSGQGGTVEKVASTR